MPKILMVAFHFPPMTGSSGQMRTVSFANTLTELGWEVHVLTASAIAHVRLSENTDVSPDVRVHTAFALDAARHLSVAGRYPAWFEVPDRWWTWAVPGILKGLQIVRRNRPDVIWATYPIATAQLIGLGIAKLSGLPLVADFRDPMTEDNYPKERARKRACVWIEANVLARAKRIVFTSPGTLAMYRERYPVQSSDKLRLVENGYDGRIFQLAKEKAKHAVVSRNRVVLVHSGALYPKERDPRAFFQALAQLQSDHKGFQDVEIVLRGTGHDSLYAAMLASLGIERLVRLEPSLPHTDAVAELLSADGLLLFQSRSCNHQTPAKIYEYLKSGKPILALTDSAGDTAEKLREYPAAVMAPLDDAGAISDGLSRFLAIVRDAGRANSSAPATDDRDSRHARGVLLQSLLRELLPNQTSRSSYTEQT